LNKLPEKFILDKIKKYAIKNKSQECCGLVVKRGLTIDFIECENVSLDKKNSFIIEPNNLIEHDVIYIFHSHLEYSAKPSFCDKKFCDEIDIPFLIYSLRDDEFGVYYKSVYQ
tara:strand:+ start:7370 stop:7708 length:339 start_codon:yes stop_codon:yes gene_type:complete